MMHNHPMQSGVLKWEISRRRRLIGSVELNRDTRGLRHASCVEEELASCQLHQWFHSALL